MGTRRPPKPRPSRTDFPRLSDEALLDALDTERRKFTTSDAALMRRMADELISGWGARWHVWREPLQCPHCKADLRDHRTGPPFKREIGQYDMDEDRTVAFICPDCGLDLSAGPTAWERVLKT